MRRFAIPLLATTLLASPALAAEPTKEDLDRLLERAKKEKKFVAAIFTLFN